jgi:hypothetical protein
MSIEFPGYIHSLLLTSCVSKAATLVSGRDSRSILVVCHHIGIARSTTTQYDAMIRLRVNTDWKDSLDGSTGGCFKFCAASIVQTDSDGVYLNLDGG